MPPYTSKDLYKTKLCILFQRGGCPRTSCTFAHGEDELRRLSVHGGGESRRDPDSARYKPHDRDYRGSPPSSRRRSPSEDYSGSPSRRGRSADRGGGRKRADSDSISRSHSDRSLSYSASPPRRGRNKRHRDFDRDYSDESPRSRRSYSPPPRSNNHELEKEEKLDIGKHASDELESRTADLESRLAGADENLRRANSQMRKLAKVHLKASQASEDVRRYKAKLDRLASDIINEEATQADYRAKSILSDEDATGSLLRSTQKAGGSSRQRNSPPPPLSAIEEPLPAPPAYHSGSEGEPQPTAAATTKPKRDVRERKPSPDAERSKVFREDKAVPKPKRGHLRKREEYSSPSSGEEKEPRRASSPSESQERQRRREEVKLRKEARASQAGVEDDQQPAGEGHVAKLPQKLVVPGSDLQVKGKNGDSSPRRRRRGRDRRSSPDEDVRWKGDVSTGEPPHDRWQRRSSPDDRWRSKRSPEFAERKRRAHSPYERPDKEESPFVQETKSREGLLVSVEGMKGGGHAEDMQVEPAGAEKQQQVVNGGPGEGQTVPVKSWPEEEDAKQGASALSFKIQPAKANLANPRVEPRQKPQQDNNRRPITIGSNPPIHQALLARTPAVPKVSATATAVSAVSRAAPVPAVAPLPKTSAAVVSPIPPALKAPLRPLLPPLPAEPNYHPDEPPPPGCGTVLPLLGNGGVDMFHAGLRATVVRAKYGEENDEDIDVEA